MNNITAIAISALYVGLIYKIYDFLLSDKSRDTKFYYLLIFSVLVLILFIYLQNINTDTKYDSSIFGIMLGSLIIILNQIIDNWNNVNDLVKLVIYATSFVILVVSSILYVNK